MKEFYVKILDGFVGVATPWSVPARVWSAEPAPYCVKNDTNPNGYRLAVPPSSPKSEWGESALAEIHHLKNPLTTALLERDELRAQLGARTRGVADYWQKECNIAREERNAAREECETLKGQLEQAQLRINECERYRGERDVLIEIIKQIRESVSHL